MDAETAPNQLCATRFHREEEKQVAAATVSVIQTPPPTSPASPCRARRLPANEAAHATQPAPQRPVNNARRLQTDLHGKKGNKATTRLRLDPGDATSLIRWSG